MLPNTVPAEPPAANFHEAREETPLRVLLFTDSDAFAGTERHMMELALGLRENGTIARIACPRPSPLADRAAAAGVPLIPVAKNGLLDWRAVCALKPLLAAGEVNVIHAHNGRTALSAALATWLAGRGRCVFTQHFIEPARAGRRGPKSWLSSLLYLWVNRHIHRFIAISEAVKNAMLQRGETQPENISIVPNGISPPDRAKLASAEKIRARFGVADSAPLIVCAARLEQEKNVASLVSAMSVVVRCIPDAVCIAAGEGAERDTLAAQIARLGLQKNMLLAGFCEDALSVMNAADIFVLPSLAEPFGLVLLEAMALGKPVIATRVGGPREIVTDATGFLVEPAAPEELAEKILVLLSDPVLRKNMGAAGRQRFEDRFTTDRMARQIAAAYRKAQSKCVSC